MASRHRKIPPSVLHIRAIMILEGKSSNSDCAKFQNQGWKYARRVCHRHISWKMCLPLGPGTLYEVLKKNRPVKPSDRPLVCSTLKMRTWRATEVLRIQNLTKSSQAMSIPGTAGEAAEATFRWKRSTCGRR